MKNNDKKSNNEIEEELRIKNTKMIILNKELQKQIDDLTKQNNDLIQDKEKLQKVVDEEEENEEEEEKKEKNNKKNEIKDEKNNNYECKYSEADFSKQRPDVFYINLFLKCKFKIKLHFLNPNWPESMMPLCVYVLSKD